MTTTSHSDSNVSSNQFLTFRVETEEFGVSLLSVQEIRAFSSITPLPGAPSHVKGVMNLRGVLIPVIGLRERLGVHSIPYDRYTVIVVLHVDGRVVGVVVDAVSDVLTLEAGEIDPAPTVPLADRSLLRGLGKVRDRLITLIEPAAMLADPLSGYAA